MAAVTSWCGKKLPSVHSVNLLFTPGTCSYSEAFSRVYIQPERTTPFFRNRRGLLNEEFAVPERQNRAHDRGH